MISSKKMEEVHYLKIQCYVLQRIICYKAYSDEKQSWIPMLDSMIANLNCIGGKVSNMQVVNAIMKLVETRVAFIEHMRKSGNWVSVHSYHHIQFKIRTMVKFLSETKPL